ncbi:hypothetical protein [Halorarius litoreus]|uniref:hypothetical protein n=1 Tax=Halorarius litoreus TaxID=2962676 RepID=UPI0020CF1628|nr:hypothetical protein [Halorarius litoreus]
MRYAALVVGGLLLAAAPLFLPAADGPTTYRYEATPVQDLGAQAVEVSRSELRWCSSTPRTPACFVLQEARTSGPLLFENSSAYDGDRLVVLRHRSDRGITSSFFWVRTASTKEGLRLSVHETTDWRAVFEHLAVPFDDAEEPFQRAVAAGTVETTRRTETWSAVVARDDAFYRVRQVSMRSDDPPHVVSLVRPALPLVGVGLVAVAGWRRGHRNRGRSK